MIKNIITFIKKMKNKLYKHINLYKRKECMN